MAVDDASTLASGLLAFRDSVSAAKTWSMVAPSVAAVASVGSGTSFGDGAPPPDTEAPT